MSKSMINIKKAFETIADIVPVVGGILANIVIYGLVLGVLLDVATDGTIGVVDGIKAFLNGTMITDTVTALTSMNTVSKTVISLVIVAILILLFNVGSKRKDNSASY